jgi:Sulfotransferase family
MNKNSTANKGARLPSAPVIIIGMHRSGTTMLARQLEALGVFMGKKKEANHESTFFLNVNRWLVGQTGGFWDNPQSIHYLLENREARQQVVDYIDRYLLRTPRVIAYLGWGKYIRHRSPFALDIPWGWKCPMNTFTLPIWLDLFPHAKVIHIYRHGVDVANSLRQRGRRDANPARFQELYLKLPILHTVRPKSGEFIRVRCDSLEGGLSLWEEYFNEARSHIDAMGGRALELKYETLLSEPARVLTEVARFCDLSVGDTAIRKVATLVKSERAYAYREKPDLQAFAERVAGRLNAYGY